MKSLPAYSTVSEKSVGHKDDVLRQLKSMITSKRHRTFHVEMLPFSFLEQFSVGLNLRARPENQTS